MKLRLTVAMAFLACALPAAAQDYYLSDWIVASGTSSPTDATRITLTWRSVWVCDAWTGDSFLPDAYDVRISPGAINNATWDSCDTVAVSQPPLEWGNTQSATAIGLSRNTVYSVGIRVIFQGLQSEIFPSTARTSDDVVPPGRIVDLSVDSAGETEVTLLFTAPGDDGQLPAMGSASAYRVRCSTAGPIETREDFVAASVCAVTLIPGAPGTPQSWKVTGLEEDRTFWFSIEAVDEVGNSGLPSNTVDGTTVHRDGGEGPSRPCGASAGGGWGHSPAVATLVLALRLLGSRRR